METWKSKFVGFAFHYPRESIVLAFALLHMNEDGVYVGSSREISLQLQNMGIQYSDISVARAIRTIKLQAGEIVQMGLFCGVTAFRFSDDARRELYDND